MDDDTLQKKMRGIPWRKLFRTAIIKSGGRRWIGYVLVVFSFWFLGGRLYEIWTEGKMGEAVDTEFAGIILVASVIYGLLGFFLASGWKIIVQSMGKRVDRTRDWYSLYAETQIAKYIPGNIFHFAGRHSWMRKKGYGHKEILVYFIIETGGMLIAAILVASIFGNALVELAESVITWRGSNTVLRAGALVVLLLGILFIGNIIWHVLKVRSIFRFVYVPIICYLIFFVGSGLLFSLLVTQQNAWEEWNIGSVGLFPAAWLIGYIVPGASAGIGIRESVLIFGLDLYEYRSDGILPALGMRLVTTLGDILFWVLGRMSHSRHSK